MLQLQADWWPARARGAAREQAWQQQQQPHLGACTQYQDVGVGVADQWAAGCWAADIGIILLQERESCLALAGHVAHGLPLCGTAGKRAGSEYRVLMMREQRRT